MKTGKYRALAAVAATLALAVAAPALAAVPAPAGWQGKAMTVEEMQAIYQESFDKMNTTSTYLPELKTMDDLPAFEAEYKKQTGRDRKEDLVFTSVPTENDMPYEVALAYAKALIADKYGTPESELDAMGVYPCFMDYVYLPDESEWEFYFTPRRDTDIDSDHAYDGPGEYRVSFTAQSGEVGLCNWYIDDFWSYAQRVWDAGKHDLVYERALTDSFYAQSAQAQERFTKLLTDAGYDMALKKAAGIPRNVAVHLMFADPADNLLGSQDADIRAALAALETEYGLTADMLEKYAYSVARSPLNKGTNDICFTYNYEVEAERYQTQELTSYTGRVFSYVSRLGTFVVCLDPETNAVTEIVHMDRESGTEQYAAPDKLLGKPQWTAAELPAFDALLAAIRGVEEAEKAKPQPNWENVLVETDRLIREAGGDPELYAAHAKGESDIGLEQAQKLAKQAVMQRESLTEAAFDTAFTVGESRYHVEGYYEVHIFAREESEKDDYLFRLDAQTGEVLFTDHPFVGNG